LPTGKSVRDWREEQLALCVKSAARKNLFRQLIQLDRALQEARRENISLFQK